MRRCASPVLVTVTSFKFASRMNVVGSTADAVTLTTLTPVASMTLVLKNDGSLVGVTDDVPKYPAGKFAEKICAASRLGLPVLRLRAAASAAPSTALVNCALTT